MAKLLRVRPGSAGPLQPGDVFLGKLEVRSLLGRGGHASVYECFDRFLKRTVAVKVIKTLREVGRDLGRRAQAEAVVLASMTHPNLVRVIDAGMSDGLVYIVMEKLEGRTLRQALMSTGRLSVREALMIAMQIADGMQASHDQGVIHRDLKPENIFIEPPNRVKVLDFGIAKVLGGTQMTTQKDRLQGTVFYMSPEQLQGLTATPASDVFALGTMLFEMLYAHPLTLSGELPNNEHVAWMQLYRDPPRLETLDPSIPRYLGKLVARSIVKLPAERYQTMRELRDALFQALERFNSEQVGRPNEQPRDLTTEPIGPFVPLPPGVVGASPAPPSEPMPEPPTRTAPHRVGKPPVSKKRRWKLRKESVIGFFAGFATVAILFVARLAWTNASPGDAAPTPVALVKNPVKRAAPQAIGSAAPVAVEPRPVDPPHVEPKPPVVLANKPALLADRAALTSKPAPAPTPQRPPQPAAARPSTTTPVTPAKQTTPSKQATRTSIF